VAGPPPVPGVPPVVVTPPVPGLPPVAELPPVAKLPPVAVTPPLPPTPLVVLQPSCFSASLTPPQPAPTMAHARGPRRLPITLFELFMVRPFVN
jgi:hypothetical protein